MRSKRKAKTGKNRSSMKGAGGRTLYVGELKNGKPYGTGTAYFANGKVYQKGEFGIKGLLRGKEYYPNGRLRFEGEYRLNDGYGPNYPVRGNCYDREGKLIYTGELKVVRRGNLGWPVVLEPEDFGHVAQKEKPEIHWYMWWDKEENGEA